MPRGHIAVLGQAGADSPFEDVERNPKVAAVPGTVKSEAVAVYRKLGVASRSDAMERAAQVELLESSIYPSSPGLALH